MQEQPLLFYEAYRGLSQIDFRINKHQSPNKTREQNRQSSRQVTTASSQKPENYLTCFH